MRVRIALFVVAVVLGILFGTLTRGIWSGARAELKPEMPYRTYIPVVTVPELGGW